MRKDPGAFLARVADLRPWVDNPRVNAHAVDAVAASIREFGFGAPIIVRRANNEVIAGHTRLAAAAALGLEEVPVRALDLTPAQAHALAVADNRLGELADWDEAKLGAILAELPDELAVLTGFDEEALRQLVGQETPEVLVEPRAQLPAAPVHVQLGDAFRVSGRSDHLVVCGDGTTYRPDREIGVLVHDPPWDLDAVSSVQAPSVLAFCDGGHAGSIVQRFGAPSWVFVWDCGACWYTRNRPLRRMKMCFWYGDLATFDFDGAHYGEPGEEGTATNSRGSYHYVPDPRGKHLADLFTTSLSALHSAGAHAHEKPLDWVRLLIGDCGRGPVFDPFLGSGTSIVAADQLGRPSYGVELDPVVLASALARFERHGLNVTRL